MRLSYRNARAYSTVRQTTASTPLRRKEAVALSVAVVSLECYRRSFHTTRCDSSPISDESKSKWNALKTKFSWPDLSIPSISLSSITASVKQYQKQLDTLYSELSLGEGSLWREIADKDRKNASLHPEIDWDAHVRYTRQEGANDLCNAELAFLRNRRRFVKKRFANLIGVDESEIDSRDLPTIGICASGGGYRALTNTIGALKGAQETGILDCTAYLAGISGSCWSISGLYSMSGGDLARFSEHIKQRAQTPFLDMSSVVALTEHPTNKYLLSGLVNKLESLSGSVNVVDIYGTLLSSRLFVPEDIQQLNPACLKISEQRRYFDDGRLPLPIYSAVRHNTADIEAISELHNVEQKEKQKIAPTSARKAEVAAKAKEMVAEESEWQWFEITPHEVHCEAAGVSIPTWSFGRLFKHGKNVNREPEMSMTIFNGIFASAFCSSLYAYYQEIRPLIPAIAIFERLDELVKSYHKEIDKVHAIPPAEVPSFLYGLDEKQVRPNTPKSLLQEENLSLLDAGTHLNIPYLPLFRRNCDLIIALDASADSHAVWFDRAASYAKEREMKGWPSVNYDTLEFPTQLPPKPKETAASEAKEQSDTRKEPTTGTEKSAVPKVEDAEPPLTACNVWIGDADDKDDGPSRITNVTSEAVERRSGTVLAYFPLLPSEALPSPLETWSTWRFSYKPEETQQLLDLAEANFKAGEQDLKVLLKAIWQRKRKQRLQSENAN